MTEFESVVSGVALFVFLYLLYVPWRDGRRNDAARCDDDGEHW